MTVPEFDLSSVAALANATAHNLARASISDIELREALHTSRLRNGVRIGNFDILRETDGEEVVFSICDSRAARVITGLVFYDTAHTIVGILNKEVSSVSITISKLVRHNNEFRRACHEIAHAEERLKHYIGRGDEFRVALQEDRLDVLHARCHYLRHELLNKHPVYL